MCAGKLYKLDAIYAYFKWNTWHPQIVAFTKALESFSQGDNCTYKQIFT